MKLAFQNKVDDMRTKLKQSLKAHFKSELESWLEKLEAIIINYTAVTYHTECH
jgi:hemerythrin